MLPWMRISESHFEELKCLFIGKTGLDFSLYVQGIIGGDLIARCRTVLDYARQRVAFIPEGQLRDADQPSQKAS